MVLLQRQVAGVLQGEQHRAHQGDLSGAGNERQAVIAQKCAFKMTRR